jgi:hypothetical protein
MVTRVEFRLSGADEDMVEVVRFNEGFLELIMESKCLFKAQGDKVARSHHKHPQGKDTEVL